VARRDSKDTRGKKEEPEPVKLTLTPGAGWTLENYNFLRLAPKEKLTDNIYKIFGIPLLYKDSSDHPAIQVLVEFHSTSFNFAQQFVDAGKALMTLMILTDYITNVPAFSNSRDSFSQWAERATKVIQNTEFTPAEQNVIMLYINNNLRSNAHVLHFVVTHEAIQRMDEEGLKLFHPVIVPKKQEDTEEETLPDPKIELEAQIAAAAAAERGAAEEARRKLEIQQAIEGILANTIARLQNAVETRNDQMITQILAVEDRIDSKGAKKAPVPKN
jgi:sulfur relay (sulfurtransferase) complex TusBCD TusD component (DsrE family)